MPNESQYKKNRKQVIDEMLDEHGHLFCRRCDTIQSFKFHCHHIIFRSEAQYHPELHNKKNLLIVCDTCHIEKFHNGTTKHETRKQYVLDRKLNEMFKEVVFYLD